MTNPLIIIGAGALGQQIAHIAQCAGFEVLGFADDWLEKGAQTQYGPVLGPTTDLMGLSRSNSCVHFAIAIGYKHREVRAQKAEELRTLGMHVPAIVHPTAIVDSTAQIGDGCVLTAGTIVDQHAVLQNNVFLNIGASVSHHTIVGDHTFVAPRAAIAGNNTIGQGVMIAINSTILDGLTIGDFAFVGAGSVVTKDVEANTTVYGVPAKVQS